jgi:hypothetical protein
MYTDFIIQELPQLPVRRKYKGTGGKAGREPGHGRWTKTEIYVPDLGLMLVPYGTMAKCPYGQKSCFECKIDPKLCRGGEH